MRRPPIACRRAVQSLSPAPSPHVWISDDLLALAVNRFFRVSCPHQTRHGSHVPGPLEARRRAAKRRMTVQMGMPPPGGLMPPLFHFGALFGVRERGEPSWRYEAPSLKRTEPLDFPFGRPMRPPDTGPLPARPDAHSTHAIPDGFFSPTEIQTIPPENAKITDAVVSSLPEDVEEQRAADPRGCFEQFEQRLEHAGTLSEEDRYELLIDAYQKYRPEAADTGDFTAMVYHCLSRDRACWPADRIVSCLAEPYVQLPDIYTQGAWEILRSLEEMSAASTRRSLAFRQLYKKYAKQVAENATKSGSVDQDMSLSLLIRGLWAASLGNLSGASTRSHESMVETPTLELLRTLSSRLFDSHLRTHLEIILDHPKRATHQIASLVTACTSKPELLPRCIHVLDYIPRNLLGAWTGSLNAKLIKRKRKAPDLATASAQVQHLETWLSMLRVLDSKATSVSVPDLALQTLTYLFKGHGTSGIPPHALVTALLHVLTWHKSMAGLSSERIDVLIKSYAPTLRAQQVANLCLNEMLARLISELHDASLPNHGVLELVVPLFDQCAGLDPVLDLLSRVQSSGAALSQTTSLENHLTQVMDQVSRKNPSHERKKQHVAYTLHMCQKIQGLLTELGVRVHLQGQALEALQARRQLQHIIDRARDAHIVPLAYQSVTTNIQPSTQTELIHQFAYQYSLDRTRTIRQNWRSMYYLYKYMRQNELEIGPLFTKAVVRVCIIQPLSENHFVSTRRMIWVCQLVAHVEGVDVAKKIEHTFWIWRGNLILHAKSTLKAAGVGGRAHVSTLKRLKMI
ncbi:hypothetical protein K458DRAFT_387571 [Lentithecium fluviatile CBS 122367]|uniref:Uncharacterized protein n=1 Tax=Lentithecium fluviatile CBS 122367 TaxID=1168545 RepID=A0A6G1J5Z7_9PLEO|nr:hypothetical protein K458DRAFT_387571 [Lentithecium fluviatile CBS 122367]